MAQPNQAVCARCGRELSPGDPAPLCALCAVHDAEASIATHDATSHKATAAQEERKARRGRLARNAAVGAIIICLAVIAFQLPAVVRSFEPLKARRDGSVATDAKADACIDDLWIVIANVTEGRPYTGQPTCPLTNAPYVVTSKDGVTTAKCPNPEKHGLKELVIRSDTALLVVR
jgi:hypothetical protein